MKTNYDAEKAAKRKDLEQNPRFGNLFRLEQEINRFAPAILTLYPNSVKDWSKGNAITHHCILHIEYETGIPIYFSMYTPDIIAKDSSKSGLFVKGTLFGHFCGNNLTVYEGKFSNTILNEKEAYFDILFTVRIDDKNDKDFILCDESGIKTVEYKNQIDIQGKRRIPGTFFKEVVNFRDRFTWFKMTSLVAQAADKNKNIAASKGGKAKAARQSGYKQVRMMFQNKNGESPSEETKSVIDAYKICAKYTKSRKGGGAISLRDFRRKIPATVADMYDGYEIDCDKFLIYLSFGVSTPRGTECPSAVVIDIYKIRDKNLKNVDKNLNLNVITTLEGHSVPQMATPSKDKPINFRKSKNAPCGHKTCPIGNLLKITKIVKAEKWRKYNQIIMEMVSY